MNGYLRGEAKLHGSLHAGFVAGCDMDAAETAVTQPWTIGVQDILTGFKSRKAVSAVSARGVARLGAGRLIVQDNGRAGQWIGIQVCELPGEGTIGDRLGTQRHSRAQKKRSYHKRIHPVPPYPCHPDTCPQQIPGKCTQNNLPARSGGWSGVG